MNKLKPNTRYKWSGPSGVLWEKGKEYGTNGSRQIITKKDGFIDERECLRPELFIEQTRGGSHE